jgi:hypothetical protein
MFQLKNNRLGFKKGTKVYPCKVYDFGLAAWDSLNSDEDFISVSTQPSGDYPVFTISIDDLEEV